MEVGQVKNIDYCYWDEIELSLTYLHVVAEKSVRKTASTRHLQESRNSLSGT